MSNFCRCENPIVMIIDGSFKGVIGELVRWDLSMYNRYPCTVRIDYDNTVEVYNDQLVHIDPEVFYRIHGINIYTKHGYKNGYEIINELKKRKIMPTKPWNLEHLFYCAGGGASSYNYDLKANTEITDVNIIVPEKVVEVTFADGTKEKSVCREPDVFSLEQAISICISKKIMGGSGAYNNAVKRGMKVYDDRLKKEKVDKEEKERIAKKRAKRLAYMDRRAAEKAKQEEKQKLLEREEKIQIQTEAYIRAMDYMRVQCV